MITREMPVGNSILESSPPCGLTGSSINPFDRFLGNTSLNLKRRLAIRESLPARSSAFNEWNPCPADELSHVVIGMALSVGLWVCRSIVLLSRTVGHTGDRRVQVEDQWNLVEAVNKRPIERVDKLDHPWCSLSPTSATVSLVTSSGCRARTPVTWAMGPSWYEHHPSDLNIMGPGAHMKHQFRTWCLNEDYGWRMTVTCLYNSWLTRMRLRRIDCQGCLLTVMPVSLCMV